MPTDWSWVTDLLFAWMCEDTILRSHLTETKQTLQAHHILRKNSIDWLQTEPGFYAGVEDPWAAGYLLASQLQVFHLRLSCTVWCRLWIDAFFFFMATEDAFHVGSQPQEKTTHTPLPLTGWVIQLGQNGCGGWEEAHHWLPPALG